MHDHTAVIMEPSGGRPCRLRWRVRRRIRAVVEAQCRVHFSPAPGLDVPGELPARCGKGAEEVLRRQARAAGGLCVRGLQAALRCCSTVAAPPRRHANHFRDGEATHQPGRGQQGIDHGRAPEGSEHPPP